MNPSLKAMLQKYPLGTSDQYRHALREILQELVLCGLWRTKFFEHALFYGGTALRILHGLERYSEDLDFSLLKSDLNFRWEPYGHAVVEELRSWGFQVDLQIKEKDSGSNIQSAFLKSDTTQALLAIEAPASLLGFGPSGKLLKIKIEVDTLPPQGFTDESKVVLQPIPFSVRTMTLPSLFAGKMHAVLCRGWANRVKGRDWYDLVWYVSRSVPLDLGHLEIRMRQSGHWSSQSPLDEPQFRDLMFRRIEGLDVESAKQDVQNFLRDPAALQLWSRDFFNEITGRIQIL